MSAGAPLDDPARWVETRKDGVWLGKVRDFAGHDAAAFALRDTGKVLTLDLEVEKPSGREFIPAPGTAPLDIAAPPGTAGTIHYFSIESDRPVDQRGTYLGFEPTASGKPIPFKLDALALLAAGGNAAAEQEYRKALPAASSAECFEAVCVLLWARQRRLLKESLNARPSMFDHPEPEWQVRFFTDGLDGLSKLQAPEGFGDLAILARAAREWIQRPTPQAATVALAALLGTEFACWHFAPRKPWTPGMESFVEARYGPFRGDGFDWWELFCEIELRFATEVIAQLQGVAGETGVWIESADSRSRKIVAIDQPEWTLDPGVAIPDGLRFGSSVSVISRHPGRILALKLEKGEPAVLAAHLLKEAKSRNVGVLARERAAGRPGLTAGWAKGVESLQDFDPLDALEVGCDPEFLEELEALLPRSLKEARYRSDTASIQQPIVVALGWIAAKSYDRARDLLDRTPSLIRTHGVPYGDGLSPYQESLIVHARWLADRLQNPQATLPEEPVYAGSDIHAWMKRLGLRTT